jgi:tRNA1(Val) A37 N6-methylase TrmN6
MQAMCAHIAAFIIMRELEELWPGGPRYNPSPGAFPFGTDSMLLAAFVSAGGVRRFADLGCGAGALMLLFGARAPAAELSGIEISSEAARICRGNLSESGMAPRAHVVTGDLRECRQYFEPGSFDLAAANPPYFPVGSGHAASDPERAASRDERSCTLEELCAAAGYLCRYGGRFAVVHRPERLAALFAAMTAAGLEPKRLRLVCPRADTPPSLVLVEAKRGGKQGLSVEQPLLLYNESGLESAELREIYHRGASL